MTHGVPSYSRLIHAISIVKNMGLETPREATPSVGAHNILELLLDVPFQLY